jgi:hypothetical protein
MTLISAALGFGATKVSILPKPLPSAKSDREGEKQLRLVQVACRDSAVSWLTERRLYYLDTGQGFV